jgi:hypothetical protein
MAEAFIIRSINLNESSVPSTESRSKRKLFMIKKIKKFQFWTKDEDDKLMTLVEKYNYQNWKEIARGLGDRTAIQCCSRYKRIRPGIIKGSWTEIEDRLLLNLVNKFGRNWSLISRYMPSRTGKQIRERFINSLDPSINRDKFTKDEDNLLLELYSQYGTCWSKIAEFFQSRTADTIKNRFYSYLHRNIYGGGYKDQLRRKRLRLGGSSKKIILKKSKKIFQIDTFEINENNKYNGGSQKSLDRNSNLSSNFSDNFEKFRKKLEIGNVNNNIFKPPQVEKEESSAKEMNCNKENPTMFNNNNFLYFKKNQLPINNNSIYNNINNPLLYSMPDLRNHFQDVQEQQNAIQINQANILSQYHKIFEMYQTNSLNNHFCLNNNQFCCSCNICKSVTEFKNVLLQQLLSLNEILQATHFKVESNNMSQN